jgi:hypothetical protein
MKIDELEKKLAAKEKEKTRAEATLDEAEATLKGVQGELRVLARIEAGDPGASWNTKKRWKEARSAVEGTEAKVTEATRAVRIAREKADAVRGEVLELQEQLAEPKLEALRGKVAALAETLRQQQDSTVETAKGLVALVLEARKTAPRRLLSRRARDRYLIVCPRDPAMREAFARRHSIKGVPPGYFSYEYFRAMAQTGAGGRFELLPNQDLSPPPREEIEELWGDPALPKELEAVTGIDLGVFFSINGARSSGKPARGRAAGQKRLNFYEMLHEVEQEGKEG